MNRREFLRSAIRAAVVAALPAAALKEIVCYSIDVGRGDDMTAITETVFHGEIGVVSNVRFVTKDQLSREMLVAKWNNRFFYSRKGENVVHYTPEFIDQYAFYAEPEFDMNAFMRSLPEFKG